MNKYKSFIAAALATLACSVFLACSVEYSLNVVGMNVAVMGALAAAGIYSLFLMVWINLISFFGNDRGDVEDELYSFRRYFRFIGYPVALSLIAYELLQKTEFMPGFPANGDFGVGLAAVIYIVLILSNEILFWLFFAVFDRHFYGDKQIKRV